VPGSSGGKTPTERVGKGGGVGDKRRGGGKKENASRLLRYVYFIENKKRKKQEAFQAIRKGGRGEGGEIGGGSSENGLWIIIFRGGDRDKGQLSSSQQWGGKGEKTKLTYQKVENTGGIISQFSVVTSRVVRFLTAGEECFLKASGGKTKGIKEWKREKPFFGETRKVYVFRIKEEMGANSA